MSEINSHFELRNKPRLEHVAPASLLRQDYLALQAKTHFRCSEDVSQLLMIQSVEGHAHAGHGQFYGKTYPNTTQSDVAQSLRIDPKTIQHDRQELIDEVIDLVKRMCSGESVITATNRQGEPLLMCGLLRHIEIDTNSFLIGLYLGGLRDTYKIREQANQLYGIEMGYGKGYMVNQNVMKRLGLNGYDLANKSNENEMDRYKREGLFEKDSSENMAFMYIRYRTGFGASDDAAIVIAGKLYGLSAAIGCFIADAIDTLEKYAKASSDQDSIVSEIIEKEYIHLKVTRKDSATLAYLCAIPTDMHGHLPDSSLRHLLEIDTRIDQSTIESHLAYVAEMPYSEMELDHGECTNIEFYSYINKHLCEFKNASK